jgi:ABC-type uncharacterized transport system ATPase subunit
MNTTFFSKHLNTIARAFSRKSELEARVSAALQNDTARPELLQSMLSNPLILLTKEVAHANSNVKDIIARAISKNEVYLFTSTREFKKKKELHKSGYWMSEGKELFTMGNFSSTFEQATGITINPYSEQKIRLTKSEVEQLLKLAKL